MEIPVEIYAPHGTPHAELQPSFLGDMASKGDLPVNMPAPQFIKPGWVAMVDTVRRLQSQPYHPPVGRTTFQKIAYVLTEEGVDTGLEYRRSSCGPYAPDLKQVIGRLMNNGLVQERRLGQMLEVRTGSTYEDARRAYASQLQECELAIRRTTDLFMRVNTQEAEIVATVIFAHRELVHNSEEPPTEMDVLRAVMDWKKRRRPPLDKQEVALHIRNLAALGWLKVKPSDDLPLPADELEAVQRRGGVAMTEQRWPEVECQTCGKKIRLVKTAAGWKPYQLKVFAPHKCPNGPDVYDHPDKIVPLFNPKKSRFEK